MAEKKAKTAESRGADARKHQCPSCNAESRVIFYTGFGKKGFFWVCEKNCGYSARTR
jgi:transcription elongation factor Elf1